MEHKLPGLDQLRITPDAVRQEARAVHARLEALQALMSRQRTATTARRHESPLGLDCRAEPAGAEA